VASVRADQIARQIPARGELASAALLGRGAKALSTKFHRVRQSSNLLIAQFL
jgi:hypothetical protein